MNETIEEVVKSIKNDEELNSLLSNGCELHTYWNDSELVFQYGVLIDVDVIDFRLSTITDKINDIVTDSNMTLNIASPYRITNSTDSDYVAYELKYLIK